MSFTPEALLDAVEDRHDTSPNIVTGDSHVAVMSGETANQVDGLVGGETEGFAGVLEYFNREQYLAAQDAAARRRDEDANEDDEPAAD